MDSKQGKILSMFIWDLTKLKNWQARKPIVDHMDSCFADHSTIMITSCVSHSHDSVWNCPIFYQQAPWQDLLHLGLFQRYASWNPHPSMYIISPTLKWRVQVIMTYKEHRKQRFSNIFTKLFMTNKQLVVFVSYMLDKT